MHRIVLFVFFVLAATWAAGSRAQESPPDLAQAEGLIAAGKGEEAWRLLSPHEFALAGRKDYDYLLGVAALESGRADRATLIFERVLAVNANHAAARLDMARAYHALGDYERARTEFESVLKFNPPAAARATVQRYLAAIDARARPGARLTAYLEASLGIDTNLNAATSRTSLFIPLFGVDFSLAGASTRRSDEFLAAGGGLEGTFPVTERWSLLAGADVKQRVNFTADTFDYRSTDLRLGAAYTTERDLVRFSLGHNDYDLDNAYYRRMGITSLDWRRTLDARTQLSLFGQDTRIRYVQAAARSNSSNLFLYGAGAVRSLDPATRTLLFGSLFRGVDVATDARSDGDRRLNGARIGAQRALRHDADWFASLSYQKSSYETRNTVFGALREDHQYDATIGVNWQATPGWLVRPQLSYTRNDSNLAINDYDRVELSVTVRREWR